jgi:hypothetical protein
MFVMTTYILFKLRTYRITSDVINIVIGVVNIMLLHNYRNRPQLNNVFIVRVLDLLN